MILQSYQLVGGAVIAALAWLLASYLFSYFVSYRTFRSIPGPLYAKFSNLWISYIQFAGDTVEVVDQLHKKHGSIVRIQPNHISIAHESAVQAVYGHANGCLKSDFYDVYHAGKPSVFTTRSKTEYLRKKKYISPALSMSYLAKCEPLIDGQIDEFLRKVDKFAAPANGKQADGTSFNCLAWFNYLTIDIIGELTFGAPLGLLDNNSDLASLHLTPESNSIHAPVIKAIGDRANISAVLGRIPWIHPWAMKWPAKAARQNIEWGMKLGMIAINRLKNRLDGSSPDRTDILHKLIEAQKGSSVEETMMEVVPEMMTQLVAGTDTSANTLGAIAWYVAKTPGVQERLQKELDAAMPPDLAVPLYQSIQALPYLDIVVKETMRVHSMVGIGLPREVPLDGPGIHILGEYFPPGTHLSVPPYTLHHSEEIWGPDAMEFKPERWDRVTQQQKDAFFPFQIGMRACFGRNLGELEMKVITATFFRRYQVEMELEEFATRPGFLRKPVPLFCTVKRR